MTPLPGPSKPQAIPAGGIRAPVLEKQPHHIRVPICDGKDDCFVAFVGGMHARIAKEPSDRFRAATSAGATKRMVTVRRQIDGSPRDLVPARTDKTDGQTVFFDIDIAQGKYVQQNIARQPFDGNKTRRCAFAVIVALLLFAFHRGRARVKSDIGDSEKANQVRAHVSRKRVHFFVLRNSLTRSSYLQKNISEERTN